MLGSARQRGFNLTEAMITVSVMALLVAAMVPSMQEWMRNTQVRTMAEAAQNGLQKARMEALRRNKVVTFWLVSPAAVASLDNSCSLASDSGSWVISTEDPSSKCATAPSATVSPGIVETYGAGTAAAGITVAGRASDGTTEASAVSFTGFGQPVQSASRIATLDMTHSQSGARRLRITISSSGGIRMCDRDVAAGDTRACS